MINLDVSSFKTDAVPSVFYMFSGCGNLQNLKLDNFEFTKLPSGSNFAFDTNRNRNTDIKVKNATEKNWLASKYPTFTNIHE